MRNIFTETYEKEQELKRAYDAAATEGQREEIRKEFQKLMNKIGELEPADQMLWRAYEQARECGNERIDLNDCISEEKVVDWIRGFRKYGFKEFTFSSTWSSTVEVAWLFTKEGCTLEGLVEINSNHKKFMSDEYEKAHGYLFKIN